MKIIGITGGVGSGKSQVLSYIKERYNAVVCQADQVAWELQKPGNVCYREIVKHFGTAILNSDATINRGELGSIVFENKEELLILNQIMHPAVQQAILEFIDNEKSKGTTLFVLESAILLETGYNAICDEMWYIYADEQSRRERLKESRMYSDEKIDGIMANQLAEEKYRENCLVVIDNSGDFNDTCYEIDRVIQGVN